MFPRKRSTVGQSGWLGVMGSGVRQERGKGDYIMGGRREAEQAAKLREEDGGSFAGRAISAA